MPRRESSCALRAASAAFRAMRWLFAALTATSILGWVFAPALLAPNCNPAALHGCCDSMGSAAPSPSVAGESLSCACDELRTAPVAAATVPDRLTMQAPMTLCVGIVRVLLRSNSDWQLEVQPQFPDLPGALGPPLRLRI
jgi:hypothetical protein